MDLYLCHKDPSLSTWEHHFLILFFVEVLNPNLHTAPCNCSVCTQIFCCLHRHPALQLHLPPPTWTFCVLLKLNNVNPNSQTNRCWPLKLLMRFYLTASWASSSGRSPASHLHLTDGGGPVHPAYEATALKHGYIITVVHDMLSFIKIWNTSDSCIWKMSLSTFFCVNYARWWYSNVNV